MVFLKRSVLTFAWREGKKQFWKNTLSIPDRDLNLDLPVIDSLVYCESSALDHVATKAVMKYQNPVSPTPQRSRLVDGDLLPPLQTVPDLVEPHPCAVQGPGANVSVNKGPRQYLVRDYLLQVLRSEGIKCFVRWSKHVPLKSQLKGPVVVKRAQPLPQQRDLIIPSVKSVLSTLTYVNSNTEKLTCQDALQGCWLSLNTAPLVVAMKRTVGSCYRCSGTEAKVVAGEEERFVGYSPEQAVEDTPIWYPGPSFVHRTTVFLVENLTKSFDRMN
uniref:Uncharacterized protein n=1 Tax=Timema genevievae TaxID=629358 RepID=A0A7R9JU76_TIMGE|nr:unnamed protein product [Timema genevievae]